MKKISYVFTLIALLLLPTICFAQTIEKSNIISDIKVENPSTESDGEKDKIIVSFKVLKDLDIEKGDSIHFEGDLTSAEPEGRYVGFFAHLYKGYGDVKLDKENIKLATDGNCTNATEITESKISKDSTICAIQEVEKGMKLSGDISIAILFNNGTDDEILYYDIEKSNITSVNYYNLAYEKNMYNQIVEYYNNYVQSVESAPGINILAFVFPNDVEKEPYEVAEIEWDYSKDLNYYVKLIDEGIAKAGIKYNPQVENNAMKKDVLSGLKATKQKAEFETKKDDKVLYAWTFDGAAMEGTDFDIDMNLSIGESTNKDKIEKLVKNKKEALVLEFAYHGELPKGTSVKVNVSDAYKDNDTLSLYYYNDQGKLELVSKGIKVSNGFAEFALEHCSEYVLVKENNSNNAQTSSMNVVFYGILGISSLLGGMYIIKTRKEA